MAKLSEPQRIWLTGLRDDLDFDRKHVPNPATEAACERRGWTAYKRIDQMKMAWRITPAGRNVLSSE